jgi:hypothetical protein
VCLQASLVAARSDYAPTETDTAREEGHVLNLLWENNGWLPRKTVAESLKANFESMQTPLRRTNMLKNAYANGSMYVAKGPFRQIVGITKKDAEAALRLAPPGFSVGKADENNCPLDCQQAGIALDDASESSFSTCSTISVDVTQLLSRMDVNEKEEQLAFLSALHPL